MKTLYCLLLLTLLPISPKAETVTLLEVDTVWSYQWEVAKDSMGQDIRENHGDYITQKVVVTDSTMRVDTIPRTFILPEWLELRYKTDTSYCYGPKRPTPRWTSPIDTSGAKMYDPNRDPRPVLYWDSVAFTLGTSPDTVVIHDTVWRVGSYNGAPNLKVDHVDTVRIVDTVFRDGMIELNVVVSCHGVGISRTGGGGHSIAILDMGGRLIAEELADANNSARFVVEPEPCYHDTVRLVDTVCPCDHAWEWLIRDYWLEYEHNDSGWLINPTPECYTSNHWTGNSRCIYCGQLRTRKDGK